MPRAKRLCSSPGCVKGAVSNGRCEKHPFQRYAKAWDRNTPYGSLGPPIPPTLKSRVLKEEATCAICGQTESSEVDHIVPRYLGGSNARENLQGLCKKCHAVKTAAEGHAALAAKRHRQNPS